MPNLSPLATEISLALETQSKVYTTAERLVILENIFSSLVDPSSSVHAPTYSAYREYLLEFPGFRKDLESSSTRIERQLATGILLIKLRVLSQTNPSFYPLELEVESFYSLLVRKPLVELLAIEGPRPPITQGTNLQRLTDKLENLFQCFCIWK